MWWEGDLSRSGQPSGPWHEPPAASRHIVCTATVVDTLTCNRSTSLSIWVQRQRCDLAFKAVGDRGLPSTLGSSETVVGTDHLQSSAATYSAASSTSTRSPRKTMPDRINAPHRLVLVIQLSGGGPVEEVTRV